jgi:hypothetical protein
MQAAVGGAMKAMKWLPPYRHVCCPALNIQGLNSNIQHSIKMYGSTI